MPHTQIFAGTDTVYSETFFSNPKAECPNGYDMYETLSAIKDGLNCTTNDSSQYVNGPTTFGIDIGTVIVNNLMGILEALDSKKEIINLVGHSRGAVASILVLHELERIKNDETTDSLYDLLLKTPCTYTKACLIAHKGTLEKYQHVKETLKKATFNLFAIDPVPGGRYFGTPGTRWTDSRFYTLPSIVSHAEFIYYEHERTRCFKPIVPKATPATTQLTLLNLPGHHGTGSGNLRYQQRTEDYGDLITHTQPIQKLLTYKIFKFLQMHSSAFKENFIERMTLNILETYNLIWNNKKEYDSLNDHTYPVLGKEHGTSRRVHYQAHNETYLPDIMGVKGFVNKEHLALVLTKKFNLQPSSLSPIALLQSYHEKLKSNLELFKNCPELINPINAGVIQLISQQYLVNHLASEEKIALITALDPFLTFLTTDCVEHAQIKTSIFELVKTALLSTIQQRADSLFEAKNALTLEASEEEQVLDLITQYTEFQTGLTAMKTLFNTYTISVDLLDALALKVSEQQTALELFKTEIETFKARQQLEAESVVQTVIAGVLQKRLQAFTETAIQQTTSEEELETISTTVLTQHQEIENNFNAAMEKLKLRSKRAESPQPADTKQTPVIQPVPHKPISNSLLVVIPVTATASTFAITAPLFTFIPNITLALVFLPFTPLALAGILAASVLCLSGGAAALIKYTKKEERPSQPGQYASPLNNKKTTSYCSEEIRLTMD